MARDEGTGRLEHWVHRSLLAGLALSGLLLVAGLVLVLMRGQARPEGRPPALAVMLQRGSTGEGTALLELGLLILMLTPGLRVAVLALGWGLAGEKRFSTVALIVLGLLGLSLFLGVG
ncbi:Protein of unknown function [Singulisphaera sp. GP187]|nr:Protein of unknown function [Singulisphaera sp. GP187]